MENILKGVFDEIFANRGICKVRVFGRQVTDSSKDTMEILHLTNSGAGGIGKFRYARLVEVGRSSPNLIFRNAGIMYSQSPQQRMPRDPNTFHLSLAEFCYCQYDKVGPNGISLEGRKKFREYLPSLSGYRTSPLQICAENLR